MKGGSSDDAPNGRVYFFSSKARWISAQVASTSLLRFMSGNVTNLVPNFAKISSTLVKFD